LQRVEEKRILEKTKKERRQKELAKKLKGMKHVSICFCFCFWECVRMCRNVFSNTIVFFIYKYCSPFHAKQQKQKKHKKR
jgi:Na+/melibiose symporter-like transporter